MHLSRRRALLEGIITIFLWSSSFVIVKIGLDHLSPAALAGLRYFGGFLILFPALWLGSSKNALVSRSHSWGEAEIARCVRTL